MGVVTLYKDKSDEWRWHRTAGSDVVSESGEGYNNKDDALEQAKVAAETGDTIKVLEGEQTVEYPYQEGDADAG